MKVSKKYISRLLSLIIGLTLLLWDGSVVYASDKMVMTDGIATCFELLIAFTIVSIIYYFLRWVSPIFRKTTDDFMTDIRMK